MLICRGCGRGYPRVPVPLLVTDPTSLRPWGTGLTEATLGRRCAMFRRMQWISHRTEDEIYEKLVEYAEAPETLRAIGVKARRWVLENQHGEALVKRYIAAYEQILGAHRSS